MSKRVKIIVSVIVAVLLLTVATTATVMAQEEEPVQEEPAPQLEGRTGLLVRVEILGISQEELVDIFRQAQQEMRQEAFIRALDKAVEEGLITQGEFDEIKEWWESKPEALDCLTPCTRIQKASRFRQMIAVSRGWGGPRTPRLAD
jgi:hypothetical protein